MSKRRGLRHLEVPEGITRLPAKAVREFLDNPKPKKHKYRAQRTDRHGLSFASKREADRYDDLLLMQRAGEITDLQVQPRYPLMVDSVKIGEYRADFSYINCRNGAEVTEDSKGFSPQLYKWKRRHFEAQYGRPITEV